MENCIKVKMKVYGLPNCHACKELCTQLDEEKIAYEYIDATKDPETLKYLRTKNVMSFPYVENDK